MVIVDSDVWSEALRKREPKSWHVSKLAELIWADEVVMIGPVRQEVLSGIRHTGKFEEIRNMLRAFPSRPIEDSVFELAASFFNLCRKSGIQGSHTDFLLCACGVAWETPILTRDRDFWRYSKYIPLSLLEKAD
jgi:predicted nucleic acid-binding protein